MSEQKLTVKYLPGVPEKFDKCFRVQVAHFEPDLITIHGEGVFPRISLDLPRVADQEGYYNKLALVSYQFDYCVYTVDSRYLEFQGTHGNTSRYPYFDISELRE